MRLFLRLAIKRPLLDNAFDPRLRMKSRRELPRAQKKTGGILPGFDEIPLYREENRVS